MENKLTPENLYLPNTDIANKALSELNEELIKNFDQLVIQGLLRKGYKFNNRFELIDFIKKHCVIKDNVHQRQRIYFVDNTAFLLQNYKVEFTTGITITDNEVKIKAECGTYEFL